MNTAVGMVDLGGVRIQYSLAGPEDQPAMIFVHGLAANLSQFLEQRARFSDNWRVLLVSLRGHGSSSGPEPADREAFSLRIMGEDIVGVLDHLAIPAVHWVGNSMGGLIGYQVLQDAPERLLSLATFGITAEQHYGPVAVRLMTWVKDALTWLRGYENFCRMVGPLAGRVPRTRERVVEMALTTDPAVVRYAHMNVCSVNYLQVLREATIPLLLIRCEHDRAINRNLRSTLQVLEQSAHGEVVHMPGVGHYANLDRPGDFNAILQRWHEQMPGRSSDADVAGVTGR